MFQIIGINMLQVKQFLDVFLACEDPYIVEIREKKDEKIKSIMGKDYLFVIELQKSKRYKNCLRVESRGQSILLRVIKNAKFFKREVVILYDDKNHYEEVLELIGSDFEERRKI